MRLAHQVWPRYFDRQFFRAFARLGKNYIALLQLDISEIAEGGIARTLALLINL